MHYFSPIFNGPQKQMHMPFIGQVDNRTSWTSKNYHWNTRDGGFVGWGQRAWAVSARLATPDGPAVRLTYTSKDGDMVRPPPACSPHCHIRALPSECSHSFAWNRSVLLARTAIWRSLHGCQQVGQIMRLLHPKTMATR